MRIRFCGSHGTGKTTLLNSFHEKYHIKEVAREIIERLGNPKNMDFVEILNFQEQVFIKQKIKYKATNGKDIVADRSLIDILAYTRCILEENFEPKTREDNAKIRLVKSLCQRIEYEMKKEKFDIAFYLPIEFGIEDDGTRFVETIFQKRIDNEIVKILKEFSIPVITLTGSIEERKKKIAEVMEMYSYHNFIGPNSQLGFHTMNKL